MPAAIGIVGTGTAARTHATAYGRMPSVQVRWSLSDDGSRSRRFAEKHGVMHHTTRFEDLLADPRVTLIDLCNISCRHIDFADRALGAGKGVIIEKPLDADPEKAVAFFQKHCATPLPILVVYQYPYSQTFSKLADICRHMVYGRLKSYRVDYFTRRDAAYYRRWPADPKACGGGVLINQGIHIINLIYGMIGYAPMQVSAVRANLVHEVAVEDTIIIQTVHENGILGSFRFSTALPSQLYMEYLFEKTRVFTSGGTVMIQGETQIEVPTPAKGEFGHLAEDFFSGMQQDPGLHMNFASGVKDLKMIQAAYDSAARGHAIDFFPEISTADRAAASPE